MRVLTSAHDSPLGRWTYAEARPPALAGLVECLWESCGTTTEPQDRHYPHGMFELLVNLGGQRFRLLEPHGTETFDATWLVGQQLGPTVTAQPRRHHVLGIRLRPAGAFALLATPLGLLTGLVVTLEDVLGGAARELVARCRETGSAGARFEIVAAWLAARVADRRRAVDPVVAWAAARIDASRGGVAIGELRQATAWSTARLAAAFREQIGLPPKRYARVVRFRHAMERLERGDAPLADVALDAGYYDQPHFTAELRALTGLTPRQLAARYPSGVPVRR